MDPYLLNLADIKTPPPPPLILKWLKCWLILARIDILFNNGGIQAKAGMALETDLSVDRKIMEIDYFGTIALTKAVAAQQMVNAGKAGHFVVTSSLVGKFLVLLGVHPMQLQSSALHGFFDSLRTEASS